MIIRLTAFSFATLLPCAAIAQLATFDETSLNHLDPSAEQITGPRILEQVLTSNDMQPTREYAPSDVIRRLAKPVGRLTLKFKQGTTPPGQRGAYCTASLVTEDLILTNFHCVPGKGNVESALLTMGYLKTRNREGVEQFNVNLKPVEGSKKLDYSLLRVEGTPGKKWGTIQLAGETPKSKSSLFLIHHPGGYPQYVTQGHCRANDPAIDGDDLLHTCDTMPGSSGAPIFDNNTRKAIGLHYSAVQLTKLNAGKRIGPIAAKSPILSELVQRASLGSKAKASKSAAAEMTYEQQAEMALWDTVKDSKDPAQLQAYLDQFPSGIFAPTVRVLLKQAKDEIAQRIATARGSGAEADSRCRTRPSAHGRDPGIR